jgi:glycerol-3-phosphate dehydrogenase (NAD(P)+)
MRGRDRRRIVGTTVASLAAHNAPTILWTRRPDVAHERPIAASLQRLFSSTAFRAYASTDVCGVEVGGALKNVFAIAAGMAAGLERWSV